MEAVRITNTIPIQIIYIPEHQLNTAKFPVAAIPTFLAMIIEA
jgi:hypothetical protein